MLGSLTKRASLESIWGVLLAFLALLGYRMWQEATQLLEFADYVKPGLRTYCLDAYERVLTDTHWGFAAVMTLLVLLLNLGFLTLHNYRVSNSAQN
jgi:tryptophan-rich sensory protein